MDTIMRRHIAIADALAPTELVDCDHAAIRNKAAELCQGLATPVDKARALFTFVRDEIVYDFAPMLTCRADWKASHTLALGNGFCQQKAVLLAALARAAGIPALICFQHIRDYMLTGRFTEFLGDNSLSYHGLSALYLDGRWLRMDATLDRALCERRRYVLVEFTPQADALLPATDRDGNPHFDILEDLGCFGDVPHYVSDALLDFARLRGREWLALVTRSQGTM